MFNVLGWFAAWRGLRPVQKMAKVAEGISAQHLSERLAVDNTPTELKSLAIAFNDMLDRLETAVENSQIFHLILPMKLERQLII